MRHVTAILLLTSLSACGGSPQFVRSTISVASITLRDLDPTFAEAYTERIDRAREESTDWQSYRASTAPWEGSWEIARKAVLTAASSLRLLEVAADAWDAGDEEAWGRTVPCTLLALRHLVAALRNIGLSVGPELGALIDGLGSFDGVCVGEIE